MSEWLDDFKPDTEAKPRTMPRALEQLLYYIGIAILTIPAALGFAWLSTFASGSGPTMLSFISGAISLVFVAAGVAFTIIRIVRDNTNVERFESPTRGNVKRPTLDPPSPRSR